MHPRCILICSIFAGMVLGFSPTDTPRYCTEEIGSTGVVPPLSDAELLLVSSLKQVQVLMRHGARIPWSAKRCWQDYNLSWTDCRVHVVEAPSVSSGQMPPMMQFRKVYDGVGNALGDKCQLGQLLYKGNRSWVGRKIVVKHCFVSRIRASAQNRIEVAQSLHRA